ncbi:hypothetical protein [Corynebacterium suedekumii]|uniref:Uncharacterized protein n=1 Tax=Corynebacterium suedekumii TaxID=3049801 RepID=A0ABY8VMZ7_9CORY|nr:hypothetical protein [Corynebacterium suedekumii]WIM71019.1 hypothetical protein QP029_04220 [Corynebacterium suedekumii]
MRQTANSPIHERKAMGFFSRIFERNSDSGTEEEPVVESEITTCDYCGKESDDLIWVDISLSEKGRPSHVSDICESCYEELDAEELDAGGNNPAYCCGMMYDEGEEVCASCGEFL